MIPFLHGILGTAGAAAGGFESIATMTASGGETSLSFTSIPQTYVALQIRGINKAAGTSGGLIAADITVNGDTGNNYTLHRIYGTGSAVAAGGYATSSGSRMMVFGYTSNASYANMFGAAIIDINDYASTTRYKTLRAFSAADSNSSIGEIHLESSLWTNTNAITSLTLTQQSGYGGFAAGTTFALYGIKGAA